MKKELASIELKYLVDELQALIGARIDQIFQPAIKQILLVFHLTGKGKKMLRIALPSFMFLTETKGKNPEKPPRFCTILRKYLGNSRLRIIQQLGSERIVEFLFATKDKDYYLVIELFSKGNVILCDEEHKIMAPLDNQEWKGRIIKRGEKYKFPERDFNIFDYKPDELRDVIKKTRRDSIVKTLAAEVGLGGIYAEEVLLRAGINKDKKTITASQIERVHKEISKVKKQKPAGYIYEDGKDIIPFEIMKYKGLKFEKKNSFNEALDAVLSADIEKAKQKIIESKYTKKIGKYEVIMETQEKQIKKWEKEIDESKRKGEILYEKYTLFNEIVGELKKAQEKHSWDDIKKKLKGHKYIKEVNSKEKSVLVEVE